MTKMLTKKEMIEFFKDINSAVRSSKIKALTEGAAPETEKMTVKDLFKAHGVDLQIPDEIAEIVKPSLEVNLNAAAETQTHMYANCAFCTVCIICEEVNAISGAVSISGITTI